jgi:ParB family transcriptional regulator, chromosome partitioning protein
MTAVKKGLGKGLGALLPQKSALSSGKSIIAVAPADIKTNPRQPRHTFLDETLQELAASIKEHGVAQPLLVRQVDNGYELIAGERRLRASKLAGLETVPVIIKNISNEKSLELAIIENVQREDLNAMDEAEAYLLLMKEFELTQEQVAQKVSKSRPAVANMLRMLDLPVEIKESLRSKEITSGHARAILSAEKKSEQIRIWRDIVSKGLTVREVEQAASGLKVTKKKSGGAAGQDLSSGMKELQESLSSFFGTKVAVKGSDSKGKIEITYFSQDDMERFIELSSR